MPEGPPCRLLEWDSGFFGRRIARVCAARLGAGDAARIRRWAEAHAVECLYYRADAGDRESIRAAEEAGFRLTDVRVTRERPLDDPAGELPEGVGPSREGDLPALREIARVSHRDTRFYQDPRFPRERCDALYETWIANACAGRADHVLVARSEGRVAGYVACVLEPAQTGRIDLVAVHPALRGRGIGERLVRGALARLAAGGCRRVRVASQARNIEAARLYERLGFRTVTVEHSYHLWPGA